MGFQKIIIAVDDSKYSQRAAEEGIRLAKSLDATVSLVYVINPVYILGNIDSGILPHEAESMELQRGDELLENIVKDAGENVSCKKIIRIGEPAKEILEYSGTWRADIIVIGRHGLESFKHLLFGGVVDEVAKQTHIPVMLVPYNG